MAIPQATPAPKPKPYAALSAVSAPRGGTVTVRVSCQAVDRGTLRLTVTRAVAKKLALASTTLAGGSIRCGDEGRGMLTLKPSAKVRRALAKAKGSITATLTLRFAGAAQDKQTVTFRGEKS